MTRKYAPPLSAIGRCIEALEKKNKRSFENDEGGGNPHRGASMTLAKSEDHKRHQEERNPRTIILILPPQLPP